MKVSYVTSNDRLGLDLAGGLAQNRILEILEGKLKSLLKNLAMNRGDLEDCQQFVGLGSSRLLAENLGGE